MYWNLIHIFVSNHLFLNPYQHSISQKHYKLTIVESHIIIILMLRYLSKPLFKPSATRSASTAVKPTSDYIPNDSNTRNWLTRLGEISNTPDSKSYLGQLTTIVNLFNRKAADIPQDIDWSEWEGKIQTKGLVEKIKTNFEALNKEQYRVDDIINKVLKADTGNLQDLSLQMQYHTNLWINKYTQLLTFLMDSETVANPQEYTADELFDLFPGMQEWSQSLWETHCYIAGSRSDVNLWGYMRAQFSWGRKVITFFRHPADDNRGYKATKNTLGR